MNLLFYVLVAIAAISLAAVTVFAWFWGDGDGTLFNECKGKFLKFISPTLQRWARGLFVLTCLCLLAAALIAPKVFGLSWLGGGWLTIVFAAVSLFAWPLAVEIILMVGIGIKKIGLAFWGWFWHGDGKHYTKYD